MELRKCKKCNIEHKLTADNWYIRKETGTITTYTCKECVKKASKKSREKALATDREGHNRAAWGRRILNKYGISLDEYTIIMKTNTSCTICGKVPSGKFADKLVYDHCHTTGKFRGVLCNKCNVSIGMIGDTAESLLKAYNYLRKFEDKTKGNND